jgi:hypothetical protein
MAAEKTATLPEETHREFLTCAGMAAGGLLVGALASPPPPTATPSTQQGVADTILINGKVITVEPGKLADLAVWGSGPLTATPAKLLQIPIVMTVIGGMNVYQA